MDFFYKILQSMGIDSAKINTLLNNTSVRPGETVSGIIEIQGGLLAQEINAIILDLRVDYLREKDKNKFSESATIERFQICDKFIIDAKELKQIPFSILIPMHTPISINPNSVWIETDLDISLGLDSTYRNYIEILPHPYMDVVLDALVKHMNFYMKGMENQYHPRYGAHIPFIQEFEFSKQIDSTNQMHQLEMVSALQSNGIKILMELNRTTRSFEGFFANTLDRNEKKINISFTKEQLDRGSNHIADCLSTLIKTNAK